MPIVYSRGVKAPEPMSSEREKGLRILSGMLAAILGIVLLLQFGFRYARARPAPSYAPAPVMPQVGSYEYEQKKWNSLHFPTYQDVRAGAVISSQRPDGSFKYMPGMDGPIRNPDGTLHRPPGYVGPVLDSHGSPVESER